MQSGHGKMDDRGDKFIINSASSSFSKNLMSTRNTIINSKNTATNTAAAKHSCIRKVLPQQKQKQLKQRQQIQDSILCSTSKKQYFKNSFFPCTTTSKEATMWNEETQEEYKIRCENETDKLSSDENTCTNDSCSNSSSSDFCCATATRNNADATLLANWTSFCNDPSHLLSHHRSRIKVGTIPSQFFPNFCDDDKKNNCPSSSPSKPRCRQLLARTKRREKQLSSSTNSISPRSTNTTTTTSTPLNSTSPSKFLLTFLSTCHLVQVTSRFLVAFSILFLILLHVVPGAYCASSSTAFSSSASSLKSGAAIIITQSSYLNQSSVVNLVGLYPKSELSRGGRNGALLKMTAKQDKQINMLDGEGVVDEDDFPEVENVHSKNQLVITKRSTYSNNNNNNDFSNDNKSSDKVQHDEEGVVDYKSAKTDSKLGNSNYDYYNNGNNNIYNDKVSNNNRSNYNYYDSFLVESNNNINNNGEISENNSNVGHQQPLIKDKSTTITTTFTRNNNDYSENQKAASDNNNTQPEVGLIIDGQQPLNRGSSSSSSSSSRTEDGVIYSDDFNNENNDPASNMLDPEKASTAKDGITIPVGSVGVSGSVGRTNNGTTKAERDSILNVSSTGVRPTMAFTKSYYGRGQLTKGMESGNNEDQEEEIYNGGGEEEMDLYGVSQTINNPDENGEVVDSEEELIQADTSSHHHHSYSLVDNKGEKSSRTSGSRPGVKNDGNYKRRGKSRKLLDEQQQGKGGGGGDNFHAVSSASHHHHHSLELLPTTKIISTTRTTITAADPKGDGGVTSSKHSLAATAVAKGNGGNSPITPTHFSPEIKVKSIKSSSFPENKNKNSEGLSRHFSINEINFSSSSSTTSFHYPNESSNNNNVPLVVSSSRAPSSPAYSSSVSSSSSYSSTLSNQNNLVHHHQHHHQTSPHHYEVLPFGENREYVDDVAAISIIQNNNNNHNEDQVKVDDDGAGEEDEFLDDNEQEINPADENRNGKKNRLNNLTKNMGNNQMKAPSNPQTKSFPPNNQNFVELFPGVKNRGELWQMQAQPTKSGGDSKTTSPNDSLLSHMKYSKKNADDQLMLGDDPSDLIGRDNVYSKRSSLSANSISTTAQTFSGRGNGKNNGKPRSPLQIRRDLSRLIATAAGRNGQNSAGGLLVAEDEPIPNKCDRLFMSSGPGAPPNGTSGTFESPTMISEEGHLYQCIFMFVAKPSERVEVVFQQFSVRGTPPECVHEWVDIWTEVEGTDPTDLVTTPFSGRYCGKIPPRRRISLYGGIAIGFYSDKNSTDETIFRGTYAFINDSPYQIGTPVPRTLCSYTILGASKRNGDLISPTYPGVYPKNLSCSYKFIGIEGQRIRLEFRDFDVFYGGAHCPFDEVKVYDGMEPSAPLIGTYCGQQRNLVVFSSAHLMLVTFTTLERSTEAQNRGFKGVWEFSESFVKLDFIEKNMGTHIRGTECDQRILSKGQSSGVVYSPNYPFPYVPKIVCRYFIYGLQDPQHLERVRLSFEKFDVITTSNSAEDETTNQSEAKKCGDGFLKVYLKGQEVIQAYDKADFEFCGKEVPHDVVSDGPRLVLVFSSGEAVGSGFKARYQFETEYRVPGTAAPDGSCHFTYYSSSRMKGEFNSPRFPSNYPSMTNCTYIFFQQPNEQVRIVFDNFKMKSDKFNYTDRGAYGDYCEEDWVEVWNVISDAEDRLVGRYCGSTAPGPIESREKASALKVILHTDDEGVSSGFKARYIYFTAKTIFGECGQNITQAQSGVLTSPKWPGKYDGPSKGEGSATCNWYLSVRPGSRVMLHFQNFAIEGEPNGRGCPAAAVRIWVDPDGVPVELCGESLTVDNSQYVSARNLMRVTFITADKAVGAPGFRAVWTEVQEISRQSTGACHHSYFRCEKSLFCIPAELRCDGVYNCGATAEGENDSSDEDRCGLEFGDMNFIIAVIIGVAIALFVIVLLCAWGQRRKRRRRRRLQLRRPPIHVCDNAGARFAAMDSV